MATSAKQPVSDKPNHFGGWEWNLLTNTVHWSPPLFAIFGRDPALGPLPWDQHDKIFAAEDHQRLKEAVERCRDSGEACMMSCTGRREDNGQPVDLEVQCSAIRDSDGRIRGLCGAVLDRTVKKSIERRLRRMEELLAATERLTRVGGWRLRVETGEVQWTPMINEIHEVPPGFEPNLERALSFYTEGSRIHMERVISEAIATSEPWDTECDLLTATGRKIRVRSLGRAIFREGRCVELVGAFQDITEQKRIEDELVRQREFSRTILENIEAGVVVCDEAGRLLLFNRVARGWHGCDPASIPPDRWSESYNLYLPDGETPIPPDQVPLMRAWRGETVTNVEIVIKPAGRPPRHVLCGGAPLHSATGQFAGAVVVMTDLTKRKAAEQALQQAKQSAEEADRAKSSFLASMSHEIRTPLNTIIGFTSLLEESALSDGQQTYCEAIRASGSLLLSIINDILDFSKIEAGRVELESQPFSPVDALNSCLDLLRPSAAERRVDLRFDVAKAVPAAVRGDLTRFRQIATNLLSNAVKFTSNGTVNLGLGLAPALQEVGPQALRLSVSDTGIGISAGELARIFEPFRQADASTTRRYGGTGLGLTICQTLVRAMGGKIDVKSEPGKGSVFTVDLPLHPASAEDLMRPAPEVPPTASTGDVPRMRILVVDDNDLNLQLARHMLEKLGITPDLACDGREAVDALRRQGYDVVLMDLQMPFMSGLEASQIIRAEIPADRQPFIAAVTARVMAADKQACREVGMDDFLAKPVRLEELRALLLRAAAALGKS
jgi:signal transduction histidine kinase/ActR/RegA family two-component response regulator